MPTWVIETVCNLLADDQLRASIARAGLAEINARHRPIHRARTLSDAIDKLDDSLIKARLKQAQAIRARYLKLVYLHWAEACRGTDLGQAYLAAGTGR